jgi:hypothetical protein
VRKLGYHFKTHLSRKLSDVGVVLILTNRKLLTEVLEYAGKVRLRCWKMSEESHLVLEHVRKVLLRCWIMSEKSDLGVRISRKSLT